jgi:AraC-like DNA-binding protein
MTPGSLFLGNAGECFECGHEHAPGDRCVAFRFTPAFIDDVASHLGQRRVEFGASRLPPVRQSTPLIAAMMTALVEGAAISWEEAALDIAALAFGAPDGKSRSSAGVSRRVHDRVTQTVREIERDPSTGRDLHALAAAAELSTFQFLRAFRGLTGATPHQYLLRARLRESAANLRTTNRKIGEIALDCGFNDLSNFNHAFRAEFGLPPRAYRMASARI